jgi:hypothetical protein
MKQLKFSNPTFHEGENITVRRGTQWSGVSGIVPINDELSANILYTQSFVFMGLTDEDLMLEHDPLCRKRNGLYLELRRLYDGFSPNEIVTVVHFIPMLNDDKNVQECDAMMLNSSNQS